MGTNDPEAHHAAPRCLISLHEKANGTELDGEGIEAWLEWECEADALVRACRDLQG